MTVYTYKKYLVSIVAVLTVVSVKSVPVITRTRQRTSRSNSKRTTMLYRLLYLSRVTLERSVSKLDHDIAVRYSINMQTMFVAAVYRDANEAFENSYWSLH